MRKHLVFNGYLSAHTAKDAEEGFVEITDAESKLVQALWDEGQVVKADFSDAVDYSKAEEEYVGGLKGHPYLVAKNKVVKDKAEKKPLPFAQRLAQARADEKSAKEA